MKILSVPFGVSRRIVQEALDRWINQEAIPLLAQLRDVANYRTTQKVSRVSTAGTGTLTTVWTSPVMPRTGVWLVDAQVLGVGATQRVAYHVQALAESTSSTLTMRDQFLTSIYETTTSCDVEIDVDATARTVLIKAQDDGAETMYWTVLVSVLEGT